MKPLDAQGQRSDRRTGASFSLSDRLRRLFWNICWLLLARWTPPPLHGWRCFVLRIFGAKIGRSVRVYASANIWYPNNLSLGDFSCIGPHALCYNQGEITIGRNVTISQYSYLCASSHDVHDPYFQLILRPIAIADHAWIAADAFVGPGVQVAEGAVLGARAVALQNMEAWTIYSGNPAIPIKPRQNFAADLAGNSPKDT